MKTSTNQRVVPLWHYNCPECGVTDEETGYHVPADAIYCEVCIENDGRHVRLRRWPADEKPAG